MHLQIMKMDKKIPKQVSAMHFMMEQVIGLQSQKPDSGPSGLPLNTVLSLCKKMNQ